MKAARGAIIGWEGRCHAIGITQYNEVDDIIQFESIAKLYRMVVEKFEELGYVMQSDIKTLIYKDGSVDDTILPNVADEDMLVRTLTGCTNYEFDITYDDNREDILVFFAEGPRPRFIFGLLDKMEWMHTFMVGDVKYRMTVVPLKKGTIGESVVKDMSFERVGNNIVFVQTYDRLSHTWMNVNGIRVDDNHFYKIIGVDDNGGKHVYVKEWDQNFKTFSDPKDKPINVEELR